MLNATWYAASPSDIERVRTIWNEINCNGCFVHSIGCNICFSGPKYDRGEVEQNTHCIGMSDHRCDPTRQNLYVRKGAWNKWILIRERPREPSNWTQICTQRGICAFGMQCSKAHSEEESHVWTILYRHQLSVTDFVYMHLLTERKVQTTPPQQTPYEHSRAGMIRSPIIRWPSCPTANMRARAPFPPPSTNPIVTSQIRPQPPVNIIEFRFNQLMQLCQGGRFLLVCKHCYNLDPRIILQMNFDPAPNSKPDLSCSWCKSKVDLLVHETIEQNSKNVLFCEYQPIRERKSSSTNTHYCKQLNFCNYGTECTYVHTYLEFLVWTMESRIASRYDLVTYCNKKTPEFPRDGVFHCPYCSLNFMESVEISKHISSELHSNMMKRRQRDQTWVYRKCPTSSISMCRSAQNCTLGNSCPNAHSEHEFQEWSQRADLVVAKNNFSFEERPAPYIERLRRRIKSKEVELQQLDREADSLNRVIKREQEAVEWNLCLDQEYAKTLKCMTFLQPMFGLKHTNDRGYMQHLVIDDRHRANMEFQISFKNPGIFGQYSGTLLLDCGEEERLGVLTFTTTVRNTDIIAIPELECLHQDWSVHRIIIPSNPDTIARATSYEARLKELEEKYKIPQKKMLKDVYLQNLSSSNYGKQMHNFLYKEEVARQEVLSRLNLECSMDMSNLIFLANGTILHARDDGSLFAKFSSTMRLSGDSDEGIMVRDGCTEVLIGTELNSAFAYECKIVHWEMNTFYINLPTRCIKDLKLEAGQSKVLMVQFKLNRSRFCQRHFAVDELQDRVSLLCPHKDNLATLHNPQNFPLSNCLDETQNLVLQHMNAMKMKDGCNGQEKSYPPLVMAGPFGTGKTHTIRQVILDILEGNSSESRILLCTHSNSAADLYIKETSNDIRWQKWKTKILRVMYHDRLPRTVLIDEVLQFCLFDESNSEIKRFRYPTIDEVMKYSVVITTFPVALALGTLGAGLSSGAFTHIFLDEASQAMEPEVIMPLTLASLKKTRVVMAGDHKQINERMFLSDNCQIPTLLERMYQAYKDVDCGGCLLLTNNYRCVEGLLKLISKLFYKEKILKKAGDVQCIPGLQPVHFIHVQGKCEMTERGEFINISEAEQILLKVYELTYVQCLVDPSEIVVTSAYYQQVVLIRDLMRKNNLRNVSVQTARNLQALQYRVVIVSCVMRRLICLSCTGENFGFLSDQNLLNTVLTRAKSLVIAVGDAVTLCSTGQCKRKWKTFVKHCEESGTTHPPHVSLESIRNETHLAELKLNPEASEFFPSYRGQSQIGYNDSLNQPIYQQLQVTLEDVGKDPTDCEIEDDTDSWSSGDSVTSDTILDDMLKKATGYDPNKLRVDIDERGRETINYVADSDSDEDEDPNEIHHKTSKKYTQNEPIFAKNSIEELEELLKRYPEQYKRCRIHTKNWFTAEAVMIEPSFNGSSGRDASLGTENCMIHLNMKQNLGRTFDKDEVVVKIIKNNNDGKLETGHFGQVVGVLRRYRNPTKRYYLCRPDEYNSGIMSPIDKKVTKFAIITPMNHKNSFPPTIPIYKASYKRGQYTKLELLKREKISGKNVYAVKYLKWSEYCPYPLGYVVRAVPLEDYDQCLSIEFGVSDTHKPSVVKQAEKIKVPANTDGNIVNVFTIDPQGSVDLDDALSISRCRNHDDCKLIGIHITDVASLLPENSPIDRAARKQGSSFYKAKPCHMLPPELSIEKCSILPNKERLAISTFFHSSQPPPHTNAECIIPPTRRSIISVKQFSYREAENVLRNAIQCKEEYTDSDEVQSNLYDIWQVMWNWRVARLGGAAYYKDYDNYDDLLSEGRAHLLIEEAMLAFNANTAKYLVSKDFNIRLRIQSAPKAEVWKEWADRNKSSIANSCYLTSNVHYMRELDERSRAFTKNISFLSEELSNQLVVEDKSEVSEVHGGRIQIFKKFWQDMIGCWRERNNDIFLFLVSYDDLHPSQIPHLDQYRSMQSKSDWVSQRAFTDLSHFSLRLPMYTKSSSPLRRYPDLVIQRCIHMALQNLAPTDSMSSEMHKIEWDIEDRVRNFEQKFRTAQLAKDLRDQPDVHIACISQITDANIKISLPSLGRLLSSNAKQLDYAYMMIELEQKDQIDGRNEDEIKTFSGDVILNQVKVIWKLRYYDYTRKKQAKHISTKVSKKFDSLTVAVSMKKWRNLMEIIGKPPQPSDSDQNKINYEIRLKQAVGQLSCKEEQSRRTDTMGGETRNNPISLHHHRVIKDILVPGTPSLVQLSSGSGKDRLPEPCIQLLSVAPDLDICVQHNREPLHIFADDARTVRDDNVTTMNRYHKIWEPLIRLNAAHTAVKEGSSVILHGIKILWNVTRQQMSNMSGLPDISENSFAISSSFCQERYIEFHKDDLLCLRLKGVRKLSDKRTKKGLLEKANSVYTVVLHGCITLVSNKKQMQNGSDGTKCVNVCFKLFDHNQNMNNIAAIMKEENLWTIEILQLDFMHRHMQANLSLLTSSNPGLVQKICLRNIEPSRINIPWEGQLLLNKRHLEGFPYKLNKHQQEQKQHAVLHDFTLIQGPPGTGKSVMAAQIAATFSYINKMKDPVNPKKVLYCGPSNRSVDVAAGFLKNTGKLRVVRMYSAGLEEKLFPNPIKPNKVMPSPGEDSKMPDEKLSTIALHNLIRRSDNPFSNNIKEFDSLVRNQQKRFTRKEMDRYVAIMKEAKKYELERCDIIVCTCSLSKLLPEIFKSSSTFGQCIIDECGMCSEPETMLPLVVSNPNQVVLIGDHKQLQPVIKCRKADRMGLGVSLFSKYSDKAGMLLEQYRMHPTIMDFPSREFYDGKLLCANTIFKRPEKSFFPSLPSDQAIFWDVRGEERVQHFKSVHGGEKSKYNMMEVHAVVKLLIYLMNNSPNKLRPSDIMVLSPYTAQCARIREYIFKSHNQLRDVHVGTVVTSQGSEADYVIVSTVRSLPDSAIGDNPYIFWQQKNLGFVCDPHQVNVALTRARYGLCIIGNKNLLQADKLWKRIIESYDQRSAVVTHLLEWENPGREF